MGARRVRVLDLEAGEDVVERGRLPVLDVHADLDETRARERETQRAYALEAAPALSDDGRDRPRDLEVIALQVDVEGNQRTAGSDDHAACGRIKPSRSEVRDELARVDPGLEPLGPSPAEEGR